MREIDLDIENEAMAIREHIEGINKELKKIRSRLATMDKGAGVRYIDDTLRYLLLDMVEDGYSQTVIANKLDIPTTSIGNIIQRMRKKKSK